MGDVQESSTIAAPPQREWEATADYEAHARWAPRIKEARIMDDGPMRDGSRTRLHIGRDRFTATVV